MHSKDKKLEGEAQTQPDFKKIQDYFYCFKDIIGQGNFSKVFKATHQPTSKKSLIQTNKWLSRSLNWVR